MTIRIAIFPTTQVAAGDEHGNQIPELQKSLIMLFAQHAESMGYDPTKMDIEIPELRLKIKIFKNEHGYNWEVKR